MPVFPTGIVTFLLTDIEGSTRLWQEHPDTMQKALVRHDQIVAEGVEKSGGFLVKPKGEGDSSFSVFSAATEGLRCALQLQRSLNDEPWPEDIPIRVRAALHSGEAELREGDYHGSTVNRCARLRAIAHGGQVVISRATAELVKNHLPAGATLRDLGFHRMKDLPEPEQVFQLCHPDMPAVFPPLLSLDVRPNLPLQLTRFFGREQDIAEVRRLLAQSRLLTLTGAAGVGKTRLAIRIAEEESHRFPDGVWFVELGPLADPDLVSQAVSSALGLREQRGQTITETLSSYLERRAALLVIDNCEHLIEAVAKLIDLLLGRCPELCILATSRELLDIAGERIWQVRPLPVPDPLTLPPIDVVAAYESVALFCDRAASTTRFELDERNASVVASVCRRLDGIPLAIELAAAKSRFLGVAQVAERLRDKFALLTAGRRSALPRQQTLRATLDWSYDLLSPPEQTLMCRLSVFAGSFSLEAAEAICADDPNQPAEVIHLLGQLADKSLVIVDEASMGVRYRLLETIREYAGERLMASPEAHLMHQRHLAWYSALAVRAEGELWGPDALAWMGRPERESDNFRVALEWGCSAADERVLTIGAALTEFWLRIGRSTEGRNRILRGLEATSGRTVARARALANAGRLWAHGAHQDFGRALELTSESVGLYQELGERKGFALALLLHGAIACSNRDFVRGLELLRKSVAVARQGEDGWELAMTLNELACMIRASGGRIEDPRALLAESITISRSRGDRWALSYALDSLAQVALDEGDTATAEACRRETIEIAVALNDAFSLSAVLDGFAKIASRRGNYHRALVLHAAAARLREEVAHPFIPEDQQPVDESIKVARNELPPQDAAAAWEAGRALSMEKAAEYALQVTTSPLAQQRLMLPGQATRRLTRLSG